MPNVLSIFSGGGGIDCGFKKAGFDISFSTDFWKPACDTLENNKVGKLVVCDDIRKINYAEELSKIGLTVSDIDVLVGGPPCPAYSKSRFYRTDMARALDDKNSYTLYEYFRALEEIYPKVFLFENVFGFIYKPHKPAFDLLTQKADELGYEIRYRVVNAANYGVPQTRERFLCVGIKKGEGLPFEFPAETHYDPVKYDAEKEHGKLPWVTCGQAIGDLDYDLPEDVDRQAGAKHKELLKLIPPGENYLYLTAERGYPEPQFKWRSRYWSFLLKLSPDRPSWTIQATWSDNMGPFHWKNRYLRINEIKRIQTFDDNYEFSGCFSDQWRQIGNAVPVKVAAIMANAIREQYFSEVCQMNTNELPFGTQFSPEQISLRRLLELAQEYHGKTNQEFVEQIAQEFFAQKASSKKLAGNTSISLKSYGLVAGKNTIEITEIGRNLLSITDDEKLKKEFAKHILLNLNGLIFIETLRQMHLNGDRLTNANINIALIHQGFKLQQTSNNAQVMKLWLSQAGIILNDWKVNEAALKELLGIESRDIALFKGLSPEQYYFLLALCNAASDKPLVATDVRNLASASYNVNFDEKTFAAKVIKPLHGKGLIVARKTTGGRGAKPYMVELTEQTKQEAVEYLLKQFKDQVGNALADAYCKTFSDLRSEIDSEDTYVKGLALEAFAIKVMRIIGLNFIRTRYRDIQIGGAEVDVLFDSTGLLYSRWQVQCKNTLKVDINMVAKEVGLAHMLKSNVIVIMTTGHLTSEAQMYVRRVMEEMNLCVLVLEKEEIDRIISNPPSIADIFNCQSEEAKKIKILHDVEN